MESACCTAPSGSTAATTSGRPSTACLPRADRRSCSRATAYFPAFSPDGSQIAFISIADRNGEDCGSDECSYNGELYVMDADGANALRLTHSEGDDMSPDWSPDGSRIAFNSNRNYPSGFAREIYSIEPDGSCLTWLTNGTADSTTPAWRPGTVATDPGGCGATLRPALIETDLGPARAFDAAAPAVARPDISRAAAVRGGRMGAMSRCISATTTVTGSGRRLPPPMQVTRLLSVLPEGERPISQRVRTAS